MNNFWTRTLTGTLFLMVMVGSIYWSYWSMLILLLVLALSGLWEFYALIEKQDIHPMKLSGLLFGLVLYISIALINPLKISVLVNILTVWGFMFFIEELWRNKEKPFQNIAFSLLGVVYTVVPYCLLVSAVINRSTIYQPFILLGFFFLIWSNDTFAYLVGLSIGKRKLWERISPKKTWEGFIGGLLCTQGIAFLIAQYFTDLPYIHWLALAFIISVFGTLGDLVESLFKRSLDIKDSGSILPGHGGILDRFDGVLLAAPFVTAYLSLVY